jgi:uncharacterized caspase-like protein
MPLGAWAGPQSRDLQVEELRKGVALWVLTVGVSRYADQRINLQYADHDAMRIAQLLQTQQGVLFREVFTKVLVNEQATREEILKAMSEFLGQAAQEDVVLIFVAGHGLQDRQTGTYYFVPHNASAENLVYAGLPMPMFEEAVKRLRTHVDKLVLWMDTCHAGAVSVAARGVNMGEDLAEALQQASGQYVLSASKAGEESLEDAQYRFQTEDRAHGAFTFSLMRGMRGATADTSKVVWLSDLFSHVSKEVPRLTKGKQHPYSQMQGTDLPIFVRDERILSQPLPAIELPPAPTATGVATVPSVLTQPVAGRQGGGHKKLYLFLMAAVAAGGAAAVLSASGGGAGGGDTGTVVIDIPVP